MPAYSFKEQFVPFVLDGSKPHTIRQFRKHVTKPGDTLYLYYGLRTKHVKKLRQEICTRVETIAIGSTGNVIVLFTPALDKNKVGYLKRFVELPGAWVSGEMWGIKVQSLNEKVKNSLAWQDGFRPEGTTMYAPDGAFPFMLSFWKKTHALPFVGNIIHWAPTITPNNATNE